MNPQDLETVYELLAAAIDGVPEDEEVLFLSKLALALAAACDDVETVRRAVDAARSNLD